MNLNRFISSLIFLSSTIVTFACGPFDALTSNPFVFHFYQGDDSPTIQENQREENIALWQKLTSDAVERWDIVEAVYNMELLQLQEAFENGKTDNTFLAWIIKNNSTEIKEFLLLAKELEELRFNRISPWYYPADKKERFDSRTEAEKFSDILDRCKRHTKGFLSDRYKLQYIRALMALQRYGECIAFYRKAISGMSDSNLFKRMAKGYVAGCLQRIGRTEEANRMFAEVGDFNSIKNDKKPYFRTMVKRNPESEVIKSRLNGWIGYGGRSENVVYLRVADDALSSPKVINRGDWLYLKAYIEEIYNRNHHKALRLVRQALNQSFSRSEMLHDAKRMELCLSAEQGQIRRDLQHYVEVFKQESKPFYFYIVPALLKQGRISDAILLANYASSIEGTRGYIDDSFFTEESDRFEGNPDNTYANTGFQLMLSRSAREIVNYKNYLTSNSKVVGEAVDDIRHDDDYLNEIIGTLYLREGNYDKAIEFLSKVSTDYQKNINVYKCGYLNKNPWVNCYMPVDKWEYPQEKSEIQESLANTFNTVNSSLLFSPDNAKLNFAKEMSRLQRVMRTGTPDERGMARIRFALARFNSFKDCWALTQYWKGDANQCNYRPFYWQWDGKEREINYLKELTGLIPTEKWLKSEILKGMREIHSPEIKAEAEYLQGNYLTIAKHYPLSKAGELLASHCDSWTDWL